MFWYLVNCSVCFTVTTWYQGAALAPAGEGRSTGRSRVNRSSDFHNQDASKTDKMPGTQDETADAMKKQMEDMAKQLTELQGKLAQAEQIGEVSKQLKEVQDKLALASQGAAATVVTQSNLTSKFDIKVPSLEPGMTFEDYKHDVEVWKQFVEGYLPLREQGNALINRLPTTDPKMVKRTIVDRIGLDNIRSDNAVDLILTEMVRILQPEQFSRLVEWMRRFETLSQGNMDYEKFTLKLRLLEKSAREDFKFIIPKEMMVAKLLLGANEVRAHNIGLLTHDLKLTGAGQTEDLYVNVENKLRTLIGHTQTFTQAKASASSVFTAGASTSADFVQRDWMGRPIDSPVKTEPNIRLVPEDDEERRILAKYDPEDARNYIQFKRSAASGNRRLPGGNSKQTGDRETPAQRKARLILEGKCFQQGCESTEHRFAECPVKAKNKDELRKRLGSKFIEDPVKLAEHREREKARNEKQ